MAAVAGSWSLGSIPGHSLWDSLWRKYLWDRFFFLLLFRFPPLSIIQSALQLTASLYNKLNSLNAEINPIRHLLALVGARHIVHVSRIRAKHSSGGGRGRRKKTCIMWNAKMYSCK
jgi:hypothetical protein